MSSTGGCSARACKNIVGGDRHTIRSVAALARIAATYRRCGGWEVVTFGGVEDLSEDEARAVLRWASPILRGENRPAKTARDWRVVADEAITFDRDP